jgi:predicted nucleic acid-binding Zn ribbon protein
VIVSLVHPHVATGAIEPGLPPMLPIQTFSTGVLAAVLRRQPDSPARTSFAWQLAVGPALARATTIELRERVLTVRATDPRWAKEISREREVVLARLQQLLGPEAVTRLAVRIRD